MDVGFHFFSNFRKVRNKLIREIKMNLFFRKIESENPNEKSKKMLFFLHGLFGLLDNWNTVGKMLSDKFDVYLVDLRNHGSSPHSEEWTFPAMAEDVKKLIESISEKKQDAQIILMGHSLGGKVAMQLSAMYPSLLEKLIVADMAPKEYPGKQFDFIEKLLSLDLSILKTRKEAEATLSTIIGDWATTQLLLKNLQWNEEEKLEWKFNLKVIAKNQETIGKTFSLEEKQINTPTLFIRGERSKYILDADWETIKQSFPNSELITLADAGHWLHAEKPKEFTEAVVGFI